jgi:DNA-binding LacI/PurR family transcriptional regulator
MCVTGRRPPSMLDVAKVSGVSSATVSRVINTPEMVSPERVRRVRAAMSQLSFVPNSAARALAKGSSASVAVLAANTSLYGYRTTITGVEQAARRAGWATFITVIDEGPDDHARQAIDLIRGQRVTGAIAISFDNVVTQAMRALADEVPLVIVKTSSEPTIPQQSCVHIEDDLGVLQATAHLLSLGHDTVHYVGAASGRWTGYRNALVAHGRIVPEPQIVGWDLDEAYQAGLKLVDRHATAIMCQNDEAAMAVAAAVKDRGRSVPEDIHVMGVDDHPLGYLWRPSISTVKLDFHSAGLAAVEALSEIIGNPGATIERRIAASLVLRDSTKQALHKREWVRGRKPPASRSDLIR